MAKASKIELRVPPFPILQWDKYFWTGQVALKSWQGFQARLGSYGGLSSRRKSDGTAHLNIGPPNEAEEGPPTPAQGKAYQFLLAHEDAIRDAILRAIFKSYPKMREGYGYDDEEGEKLMPAIAQPDQLKTLIGLSTVHILPVAIDGVAYLGFEFGCTWDSEHGLGVMTHKKRVVEVGGADTSFLEWIAEDDAKAYRKKNRNRGAT